MADTPRNAFYRDMASPIVGGAMAHHHAAELATPLKFMMV